ncbi:MAG: ThiF family adenylyltransferase, partial [Planctomycetota bacterium]
ADLLCRAGVGRLILVDRDLVELSNLQRQTLFAEADVGQPKAVAAAERLAAVNSDITIEPLPTDVTSADVADLVTDATIVLDGTDNAETRYLLNDGCVKLGVPWVYAGAVGTTGRAMGIVPGKTACLRCVFPEPPEPGTLPTCDTAGVLAMATGVAANLQSAIALRLLTDAEAEASGSEQTESDATTPEPEASASASVLHSFDVWTGSFRRVTVRRDPDCPCCGRREFPFLDAPPPESVELCGRDTIQLRLGSRLDLESLATRWADVEGTRSSTRFLAKLKPASSDVSLSVFADGRVLVQGTQDASVARATVAKFVGT